MLKLLACVYDAVVKLCACVYAQVVCMLCMIVRACMYDGVCMYV